MKNTNNATQPTNKPNNNRIDFNIFYELEKQKENIIAKTKFKNYFDNLDKAIDNQDIYDIKNNQFYYINPTMPIICDTDININKNKAFTIYLSPLQQQIIKDRFYGRINSTDLIINTFNDLYDCILTQLSDNLIFNNNENLENCNLIECCSNTNNSYDNIEILNINKNDIKFNKKTNLKNAI